ncbi:MAG TPA: hypothetical protein VEI49_04020 [Terriglobales bacterium]|nr:hypothetical protein [Terriglobales bacterium]
MAVQKKSLIGSATPEKKAGTKSATSVGEAKSLTANAMQKRTLKASSKRYSAAAPRLVAMRRGQA